MTVLAQFPSEILAIITSSLNGFDTAHLWLTGNRMLNVRLETGGVTCLKLALTQQFNTCWPKLISRFTRLESLSIVPKNDYYRIWFRDVDWTGIPSTLKHLELEFDNLESSLFGLPLVVFDPYPDPIWSPPTEGEMTISPFPLSTHFQSLETLQLQGKMKFPSILVPMLPPGLLLLSLPYTHMKSIDINQLPSGLTQLELPEVLSIEVNGIPLNFPSSLLHLDLPSLNLRHLEPIPQLPHSLTHLNALDILLRENPDKKSSRVQLPPCLVSLVDAGRSRFHEYDEFMVFPPNLLRLDVISSLIRSKLDLLPSGLQTLVTMNITVPSDEMWAQLPSKLTHLEVPSLHLPAERLFHFPACLRVLDFSNHFADFGTPYPFMSTLEKLSTGALDLATLKYAPKLRSLKILYFYDELPHMSLQHLVSLTNFRSFSNYRSKVVLFPDSLISLEVDGWSAENFSILPRGLKSLSITNTSDISGPLVANLPRGLTELIANSTNTDECLSDVSAVLLPPFLESLSVRFIFGVTAIGIQGLPRTLRRLQARREAPRLGDDCVSHFPRQMTYLELPGAKRLSNACIQHLPRTLTELRLPGESRLTEACFASLPPRLNKFVYGHSGEFDDWRQPPSKSEVYLVGASHVGRLDAE